MDVARRPPGELTVVGFALLALGGLAVTEGARSGQDNLTVLGAFAFAAMIIGVAGPILALRHVVVEVSAPADLFVGDEADLRLEVRLAPTAHGARRPLRAPVSIRVLDPAGDWHRIAVPGVGTIRHEAGRRGVYHYLAVELRTSSPLGVLARRRVVVVELAQPVYVAPRPIAVRLGRLPVRSGDDAEGILDRAGDRVRSTRDYAPGDPLKSVHWPTSARRGALVVVERDRGRDGALGLRVEFAGPDDETLAGVASGVGRAVLAQRQDLVVATARAGAPSTVPVSSVRELDRVLAAAEPGPVGTLAAGLAVIDARDHLPAAGNA
jgi:uncharacterized protein (DUF58 family)